MAEETQCYGDETLSCYGFDTTSYYDDGTSASYDSGVSDVEDFSELSLDVLERHGKYWDAQSIGDWNTQSINYARFIISDKYNKFVTGDSRINMESPGFDFTDCGYGRALGVTSLHDYVCVCISGRTVPSRIFQDLSESLNPGAVIDIQFGGLIATSEKSHDNPPTNEMLAELRADNVHGKMIKNVERMMEEAGLVPQSMRTFSISSASTVARTFQTGDPWSTRPIRDGADSYLSTWANFQPEEGVKMFLHAIRASRPRMKRSREDLGDEPGSKRVRSSAGEMREQELHRRQFRNRDRSRCIRRRSCVSRRSRCP